jgi:hypothetical protein
MNVFERFKEYKMVNGKLIEDIELKTTKNNKEQVTTGHINNEPVYIKKRFTKKRHNSRTKTHKKHRKPRRMPRHTHKYPLYKKRKIHKNPRVK